MEELNAALMYAEERDAAFVAFVEDGDFTHIDELCDKWGLQRIPHTDTGAAGVYKAVLECTHIGKEVKAKADKKCTELGFSPFLTHSCTKTGTYYCRECYESGKGLRFNYCPNCGAKVVAE